MPFNRPPRIQTPLPADEVEVPAPPAPPSNPAAVNWISIALPLGAVLLTVVLTTSMAAQGAGGLSYLIFLPIMLATYLATGVTLWLGRRDYRRRLAMARLDYDRALAQAGKRLEFLQRRQHGLLREIDPDLRVCLQRAQNRDSRLGERRPEDADFLAPRLGLGEVPASFIIKPPDANVRPPEFEKELAQADQLIRAYSTVPDAPVTFHLTRTGSVGIAGRRPDVLSVSRALVAHLVTHHWPSEVQVAAIGSPAKMAEWKWMRALPHATANLNWQTASSLNANEPPAELMAALESEVLRRQQIVETRAQASAASKPMGPPLPRLVIVFDQPGIQYAHPGLSLLLQQGRELGIYGVFLTDEAQHVPARCGAITEVQGSKLTYQESGPSGLKMKCRPDGLDAQEAQALAQHLAAVDWPKSDDLSQPPTGITLLDLFGVTKAEELAIERWWDAPSADDYLRVPIGKTSTTGDLIFDLNDRDGSHGPHGLIGGMTGSGKSEVLKTIILALAARHHPYDLNFALIDYKGGAAFKELERLPHTVGIVTDIESHATYAERVILALTGEVESRKRILENARSAFGFGRPHIDEYRLLRVKRPLPRLLIIFDEFAEFKQRHPEESRRLISIARLGRSLGVHLILATQNIQAAIDPQILQNSTFRICLKVSEAQDSIQMVGIPDAVNLVKGRAYFRANSLQLFQSAFTGGVYQPDRNDDAAPRTMIRIWPDGRRENIYTPKWITADEEVPDQSPPTEAQAIVDRIVKAARDLRLKPPPRVWPQPLPSRIYLPDVLGKHKIWDGSTWHERPAVAARVGSVVHPILGLYDLPAQQKQIVFQIDPERGGGHLLLFGSAGSGKSTLLRTLVTSLALTRRPDEVHVYIIDFGGQSTLKVLESMPHVGAVVTRFETERVERLIRFIHSEVSRRNDLFQRARPPVYSWLDYNARLDSPERLPAIYLIIDGFADFKRAFPIEFVNSVSALISGGLASGLHIVVGGSLQADVPNDLFANINLRLTFHQADHTEYFRIVGQPTQAKIEEDVNAPPPPGRGLLRGTPPLEFQAALPTTGESDQEQVTNLSGLANTMKDAWRAGLPTRIGDLPPLVTLPGITDRAGMRPRSPLLAMLGQDYETLKPVGLSLVDDGPTFLIAGSTAQSGKTSLVHAWLIGLAEQFSCSEVQFVIFDFLHTRTLYACSKLPHTLEYVGDRKALAPTLNRLAKEIDRRDVAMAQGRESDPESFDAHAFLSGLPNIAVVIDDYEGFASRAENERRQLADSLIKGGEMGISFIVAGNASELPRDFDDPFIQRVRKQGCGVLLSGSAGIDQFNNARLPSFQSGGSLPPGRGYLVKRGQVRLFQAAVCWKEGERASDALGRRVEEVIKQNTSGQIASWPT